MARKRCYDNIRVLQEQHGKEGAFILGRMLVDTKIKLFALQQESLYEFAISPVETAQGNLKFPRLTDGVCKAYKQEGGGIHLIWNYGRNVGGLDDIQKKVEEMARNHGLPTLEDLAKKGKEQFEERLGEGELLAAYFIVIGVISYPYVYFCVI